MSYVFLPLSQWHLIPRASFDLCRWLWGFSRIGWQMLKFWLRDYGTWCAHDTVLIDFPRKEKKNRDKKGKAWPLMRWDTTCLPIFPKQDQRGCEPPRRPCLSVSSLMFPLDSLRLLSACSPHPWHMWCNRRRDYGSNYEKQKKASAICNLYYFICSSVMLL